MNYFDSKMLFTFDGRVNRQPYIILSFIIGAVLQTGRFFGSGFFILYIAIAAVAFYVSAMIGIKRCHDRGRTGYFLLLLYVPLVNFWPIIELCFLKGVAGPNQYGPDPLE